MGVWKLDGADAFVVRDFEDDVPAFGVVRSARKILQSGAKDLARSGTYRCAVFNMRCQGASAGINATAEDRDDALATFIDQVRPLAVTGAVMLDPGKGVPDGALDELFDADPRNEAHRRQVGGLANHLHLTAVGAVTCAGVARPLDGARVAIDDYDQTGPAVARAAVDAGAKVVAVSTAAGAAMRPEGFDPAELDQALAEAGADLVSGLGCEVLPTQRLIGADADVLFAGSKMGLIDHNGAPHVQAELVAPTGAIPYTTKAALMLEAAGTTVLPDFVTTGGALFASMPPDGDDQQSIETAVVTLLGALTGELIGKDNSAILEACLRAESFMRTWRDALPFGRPFAA